MNDDKIVLHSWTLEGGLIAELVVHATTVDVVTAGGAEIAYEIPSIRVRRAV